jgi:acyl carrier protein
MDGYEEFIEFMRGSLAVELPALAERPLDEFARGSLQASGVDSLALTELVVRVHTRYDRELSDAFLASPAIDVPANWWTALAEDPEKGDR